jgi:hypothetical protein
LKKKAILFLQKFYRFSKALNLKYNFLKPVSVLGGAITVNSQVDQGSCFSVTIPLLFQPGFNVDAASWEPQGVDAASSPSDAPQAVLARQRKAAEDAAR